MPRHSSRRARRPSRPGISAVRLGTLALVVAAPLLLGAMHPAAVLLIGLGLVGLAVLAAATSAPVPPLLRIHALVATALALAAATLARFLPAPPALLPDAVREAWALWPDLSARATLAPAALGLSAFELVAGAAALLLGATHFRRRQWLHRLGAAVLGAGAVTLAAGLVQQALDLNRVLGFYAPLHATSLVTPLAGPFLNANQAGALGGLAAVCGATWALSSETSRDRVLGLLAALAFFVWTWELGAWAAVAGIGGAIALALLLPLLLGASLNTARRVLLLAAVTLLLAGAAAAAWWLLPTWAPPDLDPSSLRKTRLWHQALHLLPAGGLTGYGPESFADVYPAVDPTHGRYRQTWIESMPLGLLANHGLLLGLPTLALALAVPARSFLRNRNPISVRRQLLLLPPLVYLGLEAIGGMGQASWALRLPALLALGAFIGLGDQHNAEQQREGTQRSPGPPRPSRAQRAAAAAIALLALLSLPALPAAWTDRLTRHEALDSTTRADVARSAAGRPAQLEILEAELSHAWHQRDTERIAELTGWLERWAPNARLHARSEFALGWLRDDPELVCRAARARIEAGDPLFRLEHPSGDPRAWVGCLEDATELAFVWRHLSDADALAFALADLRAHPERVASRRQAIRSLLQLDWSEQARFHAHELLRRAPESSEHWELAIRVAERTRDPELPSLLRDAQRRFPEVAAFTLRQVARELLALRAHDGAPELTTLQSLRDTLATVRESDRTSRAERRHERLLSAELALAARAPNETLAILRALGPAAAEGATELRLRMRAESALLRTLDACRTAARLQALAPNDREAAALLALCGPSGR